MAHSTPGMLNEGLHRVVRPAQAAQSGVHSSLQSLHVAVVVGRVCPRPPPPGNAPVTPSDAPFQCFHHSTRTHAHTLQSPFPFLSFLRPNGMHLATGRRWPQLEGTNPPLSPALPRILMTLVDRGIKPRVAHNTVAARWSILRAHHSAQGGPGLGGGRGPGRRQRRRHPRGHWGASKLGAAPRCDWMGM